MSSDGANAGMETSAPLINAIVRVYNEAKKRKQSRFSDFE